ncbi:MAG: PEP-CTERM sorting domain-containing protein [Planctomycetales bacterium]|nr:PEP-CTERM sorting domain-containing protein [Planctomycetales bacterium]
MKAIANASLVPTSLFVSLLLATNVSAGVIGTSVNAQLFSRLGTAFPYHMTIESEDVFAMVTQQTNDSLSSVFHSIDSTNKPVGDSRGVMQHSYSASWTNGRPGEVGFEFGPNQPKPSDQSLINPFGTVDFIADSTQLILGAEKNATPGLVEELSDRVMVIVERETSPGIFNEIYRRLMGRNMNLRASVDLVLGEAYRLSVTKENSFIFGSVPSGSGSYDYTLAWSTQGGGQVDPTLPDFIDGDGTLIFNDVISGLWYDPVAASGFEFATTDGSLFKSILDFPTGFLGDFTVNVDGVEIGRYRPGDAVDFGAGVSSFSITGINPGFSVGDPRAFPIALEFDQSIASFTMTPITNNGGVVPEPSSFAIFCVGALAIVGRRVKRR